MARPDPSAVSPPVVPARGAGSELHVCQLPVAAVFDRLRTYPTGLTTAEATRRLDQFGPNRIARTARTPRAVRLVREFTHFFAVVLWIAALLAFVADLADPGHGMRALAIAVVAVIVVNALFAFWQEDRAEEAFRALQELLPDEVTVTRDGTVRRMAADALVQGDLLHLETGDNVPADCRVVVARAIYRPDQVLTPTSAIEGTSQRLFECARRCHTLQDTGRRDARWLGDPTEIALVEMALPVVADDAPKVDEIPFDSDRKRLVTVHAGGERPSLPERPCLGPDVDPSLEPAHRRRDRGRARVTDRDCLHAGRPAPVRNGADRGQRLAVRAPVRRRHGRRRGAAEVDRAQVPIMTCRRGLLPFVASIWLVLATTPVLAGGATQAPPTAGPGVLVVFVRTGCPHCADAKVFLADYVNDHPALRVVYRPVDEDPGAAADLVAIYQEMGLWPPGVPTFVMNGQVRVGFLDAEHTGPALRELIEAGLPPPDRVETALFGTLSASRLGLPLFTVALGLLDGFNPCAMWVLLFLLSLLVHLQNRARMALIAGVFVMVSGAVYYAFMAAWLNVFLVLGLSSALRWTLGGVALAIGAVNIKDFFAWGRGFSLSIPASAKPGLYARARSVVTANTLGTSLVAVAALAAVVNVVELLCTAGLPAIYTAVLTQQELNPLAHYGYLGLYILGYVADDTAMVAAAVMALGSRKLTERGGRWLKLLSGVVMLALGAGLIAWPDWLI